MFTIETNVCNYCHKIFQSMGKSSTCMDCKDKDNAKFDAVTDYLQSHPLSNALEVSKGSDIPINDILRFINEGRIQIVKDKK